jgi:hypothetical protein
VSIILTVSLDFTVIETHSDDDKPSLRLDQPFPVLEKWATELDFKTMDQTDQSHIPYVVLLVRALADWKKEVLYSYTFAFFCILMLVCVLFPITSTFWTHSTISWILY